MRMKLPGTSPPNVQKMYSTPSASVLVTSRTSRLTMTLVEYLRVMGGGTLGAWARTAVSTPGDFRIDRQGGGGQASHGHEDSTGYF